MRRLLARLVPPVREPGGPGGGPFLHWVPDRAGGYRLAGDYVPERWARRSPRS